MKLIIANSRADGWLGAWNSRNVVEWRTDAGRLINRDEEIPAMTAGKRVLVAVHGYRAENTESANAYDALAHKLDDAGFDLMVGFRWPGGWARMGFPLSQGRVDTAAQRLSDALAWLHHSRDIVVQGHSLGCAVALAAGRQRRIGWRRTLLVAPAVPWDAEITTPWTEVCFSARDGALTAYEVTGFGLRKAMGKRGPKPGAPAVRHEFDCGHSDYFDDPRFVGILRGTP